MQAAKVEIKAVAIDYADDIIYSVNKPFVFLHYTTIVMFVVHTSCISPTIATALISTFAACICTMQGSTWL